MFVTPASFRLLRDPNRLGVGTWLTLGLGLAWLAGSVRVLAQEPKTEAAPPAPPATSQPAPPPVGAAAAPNAPRVVSDAVLKDLATRYRLREDFGVSAAPGEAEAAKGTLPAYRVAVLETIGQTRPSNGRNAKPERQESVIQVIFTERPAGVNTFEEIHSVVRRYEAVRISPDRPAPAGPPLLQGLEVWCQPRPTGGEFPLVLSLTPGRKLRDAEYRVICSQIFLPALASLLPPLPVRIGDVWRVSPAGVTALSGGFAGPTSTLSCKLTEVQPPGSDPRAGGRAKAILSITGKLASLSGSQAALNAKATFAFRPLATGPEVTAAPGDHPAGAGGEVALVDAHGTVIALSLALSDVRLADAARETQPQRVSVLRQMVLQRQIGPEANAVGGPPLSIPNPPPTPTVENSWLTYTDPAGGFRFEHPQDFRVQGVSEAGDLELIRPRPGVEPDVITLKPAPDSVFEPEKLFAERLRSWKLEEELEAIPGTSGFLPESDWPGARTYRMEAILKLPGPRGRADRVHFDGYVVQFRRKSSLYVEALTRQDNPAAFRAQVESMLKTFTFDTSEAPRR